MLKTSLVILLLVVVYGTHKPQPKDTYLLPQSELEKSIVRGKLVYDDFCVNCHLPNGKGTENTYPPLDGSNWLEEKRTAAIHAIKYGLKGEIIVNGKTYNNMMMPMGLLDEEVADVMNYISNSWSNKNTKMVTVDDVVKVTK